MPKDHDERDLTLAMLEELKVSREINRELLTTLVDLRKASEAPVDPWAKRAEDLKRQQAERVLREEKIFKDQVSIFTGATYDAKVVEGIVVNLMNYRYPEPKTKRVADGGEVPNEMIDAIPEDVSRLPRTSANMAYLQWLFESTYQIDLRSIVGKPFGHARINPKPTPFAYAENPEVNAS